MLTWRMRDCRLAHADSARPVVAGTITPCEAAQTASPARCPKFACAWPAVFGPATIYELICEAEGPMVQGLGFAAVRDLISFLRYDSQRKEPLRMPTASRPRPGPRFRRFAERPVSAQLSLSRLQRR